MMEKENEAFREDLEDGEIDMIEFADVLVKVLSPEQIDAILQEISARYQQDCCPLCGSEKMPHDKKTGKRLVYMDNISQDRLKEMGDVEWHEMHEVDCPVTLIEEMRDVKHVED